MINDDITVWHQKLEELDVPYHYTKLFGTMIANICAVVFPWNITEIIISYMSEGLKGSSARFLIDEYMPELQKAIEGLDLPFGVRFTILWKALGTLVKLIYAFLFQE